MQRILFLSLLLTILLTTSAYAAEPAAYWQRDTADAISEVIPIDIDQNRVNEYLIVTNEEQEEEEPPQDHAEALSKVESILRNEPKAMATVTLLDESGNPLWEAPLQFFEPVVTATSGAFRRVRPRENDWLVRFRPPNIVTQSHILIATTEMIYLYDVTGQKIGETAPDLDGDPVTIKAVDLFNVDDDLIDEVVLRTADGRLALLLQDDAGQLHTAWKYTGNVTDDSDIVVLDWESEPEIAYIYPSGNGTTIVLLKFWSGEFERNAFRLDETVTATLLDATDDLVLGTEDGGLYRLDRSAKFPFVEQLQVPGVSIQAITRTMWNGKDVFVIGSAAGDVVVWPSDEVETEHRALCVVDGALIVRQVACLEGEVGAITALSGLPEGVTAQAPLVITVNDGLQTRTVLLDDAFNLVAEYEATLPSRFLDSNQDGLTELLLVNFTTLTLANPGVVGREAQASWDYRLGNQPRDLLVVDESEQDATEAALLISAGRTVHQIDAETGSVQWVESFGGDVAHIERLDTAVLVAYTDEVTQLGHVQLLDENGNRVPNVGIVLADVGMVTAAAVENLGQKQYRLTVGTEFAQLYTYRLRLGDDGWDVDDVHIKQEAAERIEGMAVLRRDGVSGVVVATASNIQREYDEHPPIPLGTPLGTTGTSGNDTADCVSPLDLLFILEHRLETKTCSGVPFTQWRTDFGGDSAIQALKTLTRSYIPINRTDWLRTDHNGDALDTLSGVADFVLADLTRDGREDVALGKEDGTLILDLNKPRVEERTFENSPPIVEMAVVENDLVVVADNGIVHLFRFLPNHPPLLTEPAFNPETNSVALTVYDVEESGAAVALEISEDREIWTQIGEPQPVTEKEMRLTWPLDEVRQAELNMRFTWSDGGIEVDTPFQPASIPLTPLPNVVFQLLRFWPLLSVPLIAFALVRIVRRADFQALLLYRSVRSGRNETLPRLHEAYQWEQVSSDWQTHLANIARRRQDSTVANLAEGMFLLDNPTHAGLPILLRTLEGVQRDNPTWRNVNEWYNMLTFTDQLITLPTIAEIALMEPELDKMLSLNRSAKMNVEPFPRFLMVFNGLQTAEGATSIDDRLIALEDVLVQLRDIKADLSTDYKPSLARVLVRVIGDRLLGLISAETEDIRGRARLTIALLTTHILPADASELVLELRNSGRATAEHIRVTMEPSSAKVVGELTQEIPSLASQFTRRVTFGLVAPEMDAFRAAFTVQFNDRLREDHTVEYANIVNVLQPLQAFAPIPNPYAPGTPLQRHSEMFFGRTSLFNFIAEQAPRLAQQRVLILVGQRRTGKTSALLRLGHHLPEHLIPIYVDCQSLGALPGLAGFFQDVVWQVEDGLRARGIDFTAPDLDYDHENPLAWFKRDVINAVRETISPETMLVFVFDEFEAFENLVDDGNLPRIIFSHLRHLMQHCMGVSFVFVGTHRLEEMTTDYWSVLFNIALYKEIEYLTQSAAFALVTEPVEPHLHYDVLALERIWRLTAGHPYFLQLVCYSLVKEANTHENNYITVTDVNGTIEEMLALGEVHFAYIWQESSPIERTILVAVSHLLDMGKSFRVGDVARVLEQYNIRLSPAELTAALDHLAQRNIVTQRNERGILTYELKIGLVGTWVQQTRSLGRLYSAS